MMLMPWAKEMTYQGQACGLRRTISCRAPTSASSALRAGSHHSCEVGEKEDGGNSSRGMNWTTHRIQTSDGRRMRLGAIDPGCYHGPAGAVNVGGRASRDLIFLTLTLAALCYTISRSISEPLSGVHHFRSLKERRYL